MAKMQGIRVRDPLFLRAPEFPPLFRGTFKTVTSRCLTFQSHQLFGGAEVQYHDNSPPNVLSDTDIFYRLFALKLHILFGVPYSPLECWNTFFNIALPGERAMSGGSKILGIMPLWVTFHLHKVLRASLEATWSLIGDGRVQTSSTRRIRFASITKLLGRISAVCYARLRTASEQ